MTASRCFCNHAGGILGGISTGQAIVARFAVKPTSSILTPRKTVDRYGRDTESRPRAATILASASARCRSGRPWWHVSGRSLSDASRPGRRRDGVAVQAGADDPPEVVPCPIAYRPRRSLAIKAFAKGEIVVVTDDDDRENEGDLFVAASLCTPEKMAFIIRNTSGIVCAPLGAEQARRCISIRWWRRTKPRSAPPSPSRRRPPWPDHRHLGGERCNTVRALANNNSGAVDFVRPGHVFPLVAREGGVLMRSGHTEACVDLCRLARCRRSACWPN